MIWAVAQAHGSIVFVNWGRSRVIVFFQNKENIERLKSIGLVLIVGLLFSYISAGILFGLLSGITTFGTYDMIRWAEVKEEALSAGDEAMLLLVGWVGTTMFGMGAWMGIAEGKRLYKKRGY